MSMSPHHQSGVHKLFRERKCQGQPAVRPLSPSSRESRLFLEMLRSHFRPDLLLLVNVLLGGELAQRPKNRPKMVPYVGVLTKKVINAVGRALSAVAITLAEEGARRWRDRVEHCLPYRWSPLRTSSGRSPPNWWNAINRHFHALQSSRKICSSPYCVTLSVS